MNKLRLLYFLFAAICFVSFTGCSDDDDENISPNVALLTGGEWTGSAVYFDGQDQTDEFEELSGIEISSYSSVFERDGTYTDYYDGDVIADGVWEYGNNERVIIFDRGTTNEYTVVISKLDEDELWYLQSGYEFRFVRQ